MVKMCRIDDAKLVHSFIAIMFIADSQYWLNKCEYYNLASWVIRKPSYLCGVNYLILYNVGVTKDERWMYVTALPNPEVQLSKIKDRIWDALAHHIWLPKSFDVVEVSSSM